MVDVDIHAAKQQAEDQLIDEQGVIIVGVDDKNNEIVVSTTGIMSESWPDEVNGVPVRYESIGGEVTPEYPTIETNYPTDEAIDDRTEEIRPIPGGVSFGSLNTSNGTSGFVLSDGNDRYLCSNRHVIGTDGAVTQPAPMHSGLIVGSVTGYAPLADGASTDLAWAMIDEDHGLDSRIVGLGGPHGDVVDPSVGDVLTKSGLRTGITQGEVRQVDATINVNYGEKEIKMTDQIITSDMSDSGDSGSPALLDGQPAGLIFAGNDELSVLNTAKNVEREAGMAIETNTSPPTTPLEDIWTFRARPDYTSRYSYGVADGDTYHLVVDQAFNDFGRVKVRALYLNTAEIWGASSDEELELAREQRDFVRNWMAEAEEMSTGQWPLLIRTEQETGRYNRWLAEVYNQREQSLAMALYEEYGEDAINSEEIIEAAKERSNRDNEPSQ